MTLRRWCPCLRGTYHLATAVVRVFNDEGWAYDVPSCDAGVCAYEDAIRTGIVRGRVEVERDRVSLTFEE